MTKPNHLENTSLPSKAPLPPAVAVTTYAGDVKKKGNTDEVLIR
jgi:hypothetical protein